MCYFTTVTVMFLKFCNRLFVISYPESRLMIEARHRHRTISIASKVLGDSRARASVMVRPTDEKSRSDWVELAEIQRTRLVTSDSGLGEIQLHFLARRLVVCRTAWLVLAVPYNEPCSSSRPDNTSVIPLLVAVLNPSRRSRLSVGSLIFSSDSDTCETPI